MTATYLYYSYIIEDLNLQTFFILSFDPLFLLHFFQGMCNNICPAAETVEATVIERTQSTVRTEDKFAAVEIPDDLLLQRF